MPKKKINRSNLEIAFWELQKKLGHTPTRTEIDDYGRYSSRNYVRVFGNWENFLVVVHPQSRRTTAKPTVKKRDLRRAFLELHNTLRRQPTCMEIDKKGRYRLSRYMAEYGSWRSFLGTLGLAPYGKSTPSKSELAAAYKNLQKKLGRQPSYRDINRHGAYSMHYYEKEFGSLRTFLGTIGKKSIDQKIPNSVIDTDFDRLRKMLGRIPKRRDINKYGIVKYHVYVHRYGGYKKYKAIRSAQKVTM